MEPSGPTQALPGERREPLPPAIVLVALLDFATAAVLAAAAVGSLAFLRHPTLRPAAALSIAFALLAGLYVLSGIALTVRLPGARSRQLLLSGFGALAFPVGTVAHGLAFFLFALHRGVAALYSGRPRAAWSDEERASFERLRTAHSAAAAASLAVAFTSVATVGGLVAAVALPNLLSAGDQDRQLRTLADMRAIAAAIDSFAEDHGDSMEAQDIGELRRTLEPRYLRSFPSKDAWGHSFLFERFDDGGYRIRSYGRDGLADDAPGGPTDDFDADIILEDGEFVQWPKHGGSNPFETPPLDAAPVDPSSIV